MVGGKLKMKKTCDEESTKWFESLTHGPKADDIRAKLRTIEINARLAAMWASSRITFK